MQHKIQHKIIYSAFGGEKYYCQVRYSVLTLLDLLIREQRHDIQIVIYTDRADANPVHPLIRTIELTPDELAEYLGPFNYVHRFKPAVLQRAEREVGLPFIYVDSDTRWLRLPDEAFAALSAPGSDTAYMHLCEGRISATHFEPYHRLLNEQRDLLVGWGLPPEGPWSVWNAGTVGLPASATGFFARVLEINDTLMPLTRHRTWVEQLAMSLQATSRYQVQSFEPWLAHYWNYSAELPVVLQRLFASWPAGLSIEAQAARCTAFPIRQADIDAVLREPAHRLKVRRGKLKNSLYKRGVALKMLALRLQTGWAMCRSALLRAAARASIRVGFHPQRLAPHESSPPQAVRIPDRQK